VTFEHLKAAVGPALTAVLSYDYRTMRRDQGRALTGLTGRFAQDYRASAATVAQAAQRSHAVVKATVRSIGVVDIQSSSGTCVVAVDQRATNTMLTKPRLDRNRLTVHLRLVDGRLLMDDLQTDAELDMATPVPDLAKMEATAADAALRVNTYDYRKLEAWQSAISAVSTGSFEAEFRQTLPSLEPLLKQGHATSIASVHAVGVVDRNPQEPVLLVFIDQTLRNKSIPEGAVRRYRMVLTLTLQGNRFLLSDLVPI
jgi:Mce-associated membrane protein